MSLDLDFLIHNTQKPVWEYWVDGIPSEPMGPMPLVLDLHIVHDRFGSSSDPSLNGQLHHPNDIDKSPNEDADDKIRKYRDDYNNPPSAVSFMPAFASIGIDQCVYCHSNI